MRIDTASIPGELPSRPSSSSTTSRPTKDVAVAPAPEFDREHLRLLTDKLSEKAGDLRAANARLRALINIGLEFASGGATVHALQAVCASVRDLFGAAYVTVGIVDPVDLKVRECFSAGASGLHPAIGAPLIGTLRSVVASRRSMRSAVTGVEFADGYPCVVVPIVSAAKEYGWLCVAGADGEVITEDDEQLLTALAGQVGRIYELERQIVERQQAEAALRAERDRAQRYLDTAEVILLALDLDGRVTLINRKGCDVLGRPESQVLGTDWMGFLPHRTRELLRLKWDDLIAGNLATLENPVLTAAGEERLIEWRNTLVRDESGGVVGIFSSGLDVTERNRTAEALRATEERMRFTLEAAGVGIWDMDYRSGVLQWSEILEAQYGFGPGAFAGTEDAFLGRVHPADRQALVDTLTEATRTGTDFTVQHRTVWPDGTIRWVNGAGRITLDEHGRPVRGLGVSLDITERRQLEEQYRQAQKMEAIGRLAGGVAHDFNNLLTVILGYCELLADFEMPPDGRSSLAEIQKAGESATRLTGQLLAFSRKEVIQPVRLDLSVLVGDMRGMLGRLIRDNVDVQLALQPGPAWIKADPGRVAQVLLNLALNAQDAMPQGGTLTIGTTSQVFSEASGGGVELSAGAYAVLYVTDTGTGMTPQVQARIFEPFFTTKGVGSGTGLGLAVLDAVIAESGGRVTVDSAVGEGTSFRVYFPAAADEESVVPVRAGGAAARTGTQTVLVVEDAAELRTVTARLLERQGYRVLAAANAEEAMRFVNDDASVSAVLTDVVLPGSSGSELGRQIMARNPGMKMIYMSGYTDDAIAQHGVLESGIAFLRKPFTGKTLGGKLREALDS